MTYKSYRQLPGALWRLRRGLPLLLPLLLSTPLLAGLPERLAVAATPRPFTARAEPSLRR